MTIATCEKRLYLFGPWNRRFALELLCFPLDRTTSPGCNRSSRSDGVENLASFMMEIYLIGGIVSISSLLHKCVFSHFSVDFHKNGTVRHKQTSQRRHFSIHGKSSNHLSTANRPLKSPSVMKSFRCVQMVKLAWHWGFFQGQSTFHLISRVGIAG